MMKKARGSILSVLSALGIVGALSVLFMTGCEADKDVSGTGSYFSSDPEFLEREDGYLAMMFDPDPGSDPITITTVGQVQSIRVKGGDGPFQWFAARPTAGTLETSTISSDSAVYTASAISPNTLLCVDSLGHSISGNIQASPPALEIIPSAVTIANGYEGVKLFFRVTGGIPPYGSWTASTPWLGVIDSSGEYTVTSELNTGDNTISITDSAGKSTTATVTHELDRDDLSILPSEEVSLENNGETATLLAQGGVPPYEWYVGYPDRGTITQVSSTTLNCTYQRVTQDENTICVRDSAGTVACKKLAQPGPEGLSLAVAPSSVTLENDNETAVLLASGGTSPYTWTISFPLRGQQQALSANTSVFTYERTDSGDNEITCRDQDGATVNVSITQPAASAPTISPSTATLTTNAPGMLFSVDGGVGPFVWTLQPQPATGVTLTPSPSAAGWALVTRDASAPTSTYVLEVTDIDSSLSDVATVNIE